jgi:hypothetical protein
MIISSLKSKNIAGEDHLEDFSEKKEFFPSHQPLRLPFPASCTSPLLYRANRRSPSSLKHFIEKTCGIKAGFQPLEL